MGNVTQKWCKNKGTITFWLYITQYVSPNNIISVQEIHVYLPHLICIYQLFSAPIFRRFNFFDYLLNGKWSEGVYCRPGAINFLGVVETFIILRSCCRSPIPNLCFVDHQGSGGGVQFCMSGGWVCAAHANRDLHTCLLLTQVELRAFACSPTTCVAQFQMDHGPVPGCVLGLRPLL